MKQMMRRPSLIMAGLTCLIATSLAACGGSGGAAIPSSGSQGGTKSLQKVSLAITGLNALHLWMIVARDEKLMVPAGVNLDFVMFSSQAQVVPALVSGSVNFASSTPEQALAAGLKDPSLQMVIGTNTGSPYQLIVSPDIKSFSDLKGKKIGVNAVSASADYFAGKLLLKGQGLEEGRDYTFVNVGATVARVAALNSHQVAAVLLFPPDTVKALQGGNTVLAKSADTPALSKALTGAIVSQKSWYTSHQDAAARFVRGYQDTMKWMYDPANRTKAIADFANNFKVPTDVAAQTYDYFIAGVQADEDPTGVVEPASLQQMLENAKASNLASVSSVTAADLNKFYDNSLVEAAKRISE